MSADWKKNYLIGELIAQPEFRLGCAVRLFLKKMNFNFFYIKHKTSIINCLFKSLSCTSTFYIGNDEKEGRCSYPMHSMNCTIAGSRTMDHSSPALSVAPYPHYIQFSLGRRCHTFLLEPQNSEDTYMSWPRMYLLKF